MVLFFALMGLMLEALHGFKIPWYLDVGYETRRMMLRLAHVHGTLLGVINILFALSLSALGDAEKKRVVSASKLLRLGSVLLPGGFLLGGIHIYDGDPGLGIVFAPIGALAFIAALFKIAQLARTHLKQ
ncbi:MAG: hypothetical protein ACON3Z_16880 [Bradymonadia bacterium]